MTTPDLLRAVADKLEAHVTPASNERVVRLMALHLMRVCDDPFFAEEAALLISLLND